MVIAWLWLLVWGFIPSSASPFHNARQAFFDVGGWGLVGWWLLRPQTSSVRNPYLKWLFLWVILRYGWDFWWILTRPVSSDTEVLFHWTSILPTMEVLMGILLMAGLVACVLTSLHAGIRLSQSCCLLATLLSVYCLVQAMGFDQFFLGGDVQPTANFSHVNARMMGTMSNVSYVAPFLAVLTPLFLMFKEKRYLVGLGLVLLCLGVMHKSYGLLGAMTGLVGFASLRAWHRWPRVRLPLLLTLTGVLAMVGILGVSLLLRDLRWVVWKEMLTHLKHAPWTGFGLGSFQTVFEQNWAMLLPHLPPGTPQSGWRWAHNEWLQCWYELGLGGLGLSILAIWYGVRNAFRHSSNLLTCGWLSVALAFCVVASITFPFHFPPTSALGILTGAMVSVDWSTMEV